MDEPSYVVCLKRKRQESMLIRQRGESKKTEMTKKMKKKEKQTEKGKLWESKRLVRDVVKGERGKQKMSSDSDRVRRG